MDDDVAHRFGKRLKNDHYESEDLITLMWVLPKILFHQRIGFFLDCAIIEDHRNDFSLQYESQGLIEEMSKTTEGRERCVQYSLCVDNNGREEFACEMMVGPNNFPPSQRNKFLAHFIDLLLENKVMHPPVINFVKKICYIFSPVLTEHSLPQRPDWFVRFINFSHENKIFTSDSDHYKYALTWALTNETGNPNDAPPEFKTTKLKRVPGLAEPYKSVSLALHHIIPKRDLHEFADIHTFLCRVRRSRRPIDGDGITEPVDAAKCYNSLSIINHRMYWYAQLVRQFEENEKIPPYARVNESPKKMALYDRRRFIWNARNLFCGPIPELRAHSKFVGLEPCAEIIGDDLMRKFGMFYEELLNFLLQVAELKVTKNCDPGNENEEKQLTFYNSLSLPEIDQLSEEASRIIRTWYYILEEVDLRKKSALPWDPKHWNYNPNNEKKRWSIKRSPISEKWVATTNARRKKLDLLLKQKQEKIITKSVKNQALEDDQRGNAELDFHVTVKTNLIPDQDHIHIDALPYDLDANGFQNFMYTFDDISFM